MITKNFKRSEFACTCGCGYDTVDVALAKILQDARNYFNVPFRVTSGCRCPMRNAQVGGADNSQHLYGRAADIMPDMITPEALYSYLDEKYPNHLGLGLYETFVHVDTRNGKARW